MRIAPILISLTNLFGVQEAFIIRSSSSQRSRLLFASTSTSGLFKSNNSLRMSDSSPAIKKAKLSTTTTTTSLSMSATEETTTEQPFVNRRELARNTRPIPCYKVEQIPPKEGDSTLYDDLSNVVESGIATLKEELVIPAKDAKSWIVKQGELWRIICSHGPQVADMNCWSLSNPKERFYSSKTRQIHATHLNVGDRLWSNMPYLRALATITYETIQYGWDIDGAGVHDVIGSRCDPYTHYCMTQNVDGQAKHTCHSNLTRQAKKDGLVEEDVHDVLNVFMCTGFTQDTHQYFTKPSPVQVGDYIEFIAETDLRVSASTCPQGDVSIACGSADEEPNVYPLTVQVYTLPDNYLTDRKWKPSVVNGYEMED